MSQAGIINVSGQSGVVDSLIGDQGTATTSPIVLVSAVDSGGSMYFLSDASSVSLNAVDVNLNLLFGPGTQPATGNAAGGVNIVISGDGSSGPTFTSASSNVGIGAFVLDSVTSATSNIGIGSGCLGSLTIGNFNTCVGDSALESLISGTANLAIGASAGSSYGAAESDNILLNNSGVASENNVLRIGSGTGTSVQQLNEAFICGINGNIVSNALMVTINSSTNQLGVSTIPAPGTLSWTDEATSFNALVSNGYFTTGTLTATLPASPTQGQVVAIAVDTALITTIRANTGQTIRLANSVSSAAGTATNTFHGDSVYLVYRSSSSSWISTATTGNWALA